MRIGDILRKNDKGFSCEFFPPKTDKGKEQLRAVAKEMSALKPLYVSVTYGAGGSTRDKTKETVFMLKNENGLNVMPHIACLGARKEEIDALIQSYMKGGIDNILALRGDAPKDTKDFDPSIGPFPHAIDLVRFIKWFRGFSIGVGVYPEGHQEARSLDADLDYAKGKVDMGADFCITQMFFDNAYFYDFRERAEKRGIKIPIIAGIMPITDFNKTKEFASFCKTTIPGKVAGRMAPVLDNPDEMRKIGIEAAIEQCGDLIENGVRYFHFYTLNRHGTAKEIVESLNFFGKAGKPLDASPA